MTARQRRLGWLLCAALVGVVVAAGLLVGALAGGAAALAYAVVAVGLLATAITRGRRLLAPPPLPAGRTCSCCTATHLDPVRVV